MDRRTLLQAAGGLAALGTWPLARAASGLDLSRRADYFTALAKMRASTDERLCIGWVIGSRYAVVNNRAIPMLGILAATFSQWRRRDAESLQGRSLEVAYFTDLQTGKLLETWTNPVTGRRVEVPQTRMGPSSVVLTPDGLQVETVGEAQGLELEHIFRPAVSVGDDVWITEEIRIYGERHGAPPFAYNEMSTYQASRRALDDPGQAAVPTRVDFHSLVSFRPWMGFGDTPGHTTARGSGRRAAQVSDLPPYYLELTERYHPDVLEDPLAALAGAPA